MIMKSLDDVSAADSNPRSDFGLDGVAHLPIVPVSFVTPPRAFCGPACSVPVVVVPPAAKCRTVSLEAQRLLLFICRPGP